MQRKRILIIRLSSIGDILLTTPLVRILKQKYPDHEIDFVVKNEFKELIVYNPQLSKVYMFKKNGKKNNLRDIKNNIISDKYNIIIDIHKNFRSYFLRKNSNAQKIVSYNKYILKRWLLVKTGINLFRAIIPVYQRYLDPLNLSYDNEGLELYIPDKTKVKIDSTLKNLGIKPTEMIIGIAPGASFKTKQWTPIGFTKVIRHLIRKYNSKVFLFGNKADNVITSELTLNDRVLNFAGKYSIIETAAIMKHCSLLVTNDTGLMHMASALNKNLAAIFGSTTEELGFFPYTTNFRVIQNENIKCRPCSHVGRNKCPKKHFKCMEDIKSKQVIEAIDSLLHSK